METIEEADAVLHAIGSCLDEGQGKGPLAKIIDDLLRKYPELERKHGGLREMVNEDNMTSDTD